MNNWFSDEWDYRCNSDANPELMGNLAFVDSLPLSVRDLMESPDIVVILGDYIDQDIISEHHDQETDTYDMPYEDLVKLATLHNIPIRTIKKRNAEFIQHMLHEEIDGWQPETETYDKEYGLEPVAPLEEDALNRAESLDESAPKDTYDLIEDLRADYSSDWFPYLRDKRFRGYSKNILKAIERGISKKNLFSAIKEALERNAISRVKARRLWELYKLQQFLEN